MKHRPSYVAEAQVRRRQRVVSGIVWAVMLAALALWALLAFKAPPQMNKPIAGQASEIGTGVTAAPVQAAVGALHRLEAVGI